MTICKYCPVEARSRGMCEMHLQRWYRHGDALWTKRADHCTVAGCSGTHYGYNLCQKHYRRQYRQRQRQEQA